ncbi:MAG: cytochrome-c peroxidase [Bacteroidia bacterium]|nr:MAG: cytochrome-c peroxidase [Bacteroidia bacterium]
MRRVDVFLFLVLFCIVFLFEKCKKKNDLTDVSTEICTPDTSAYSLVVPAYFPDIPASNKMNLKKAKVELGKKLYYDPRISSLGKSCSSCHIQSASFSSSAVNSLPHINLIFSKNFLWRGKIQTGLLDAMRFEVNEFFNTNPAVIQNDEEYKTLFCKAYGNTEITNEKIAECLAQFIATIVSGNSKFERYLRGEVILSDSEFNGLNIFTTEKGDCFHCHALPLMTDNSFRNIGLDSIFNSTNWGLFEYTKYPYDIGKFKVPTLINVALTAPYMHDGRFQTLEEVINFYDHGIKYSTTLDPIMMKNNRLQTGLQLTEQEKEDLKNFLLTLTDSTLLTSSKFK